MSFSSAMCGGTKAGARYFSGKLDGMANYIVGSSENDSKARYKGDQLVQDTREHNEVVTWPILLRNDLVRP